MVGDKMNEYFNELLDDTGVSRLYGKGSELPPGGNVGDVLTVTGVDPRELAWQVAEGKPGPQGAQGLPGPVGPQGPIGATGEPGASAYQVAVDNGYTGTEEEWLASLKGAPGNNGSDGAPGENGTTFTPHISEDGTLTWTNDGNLPNPDPINIGEGAEGPQGPKGEQGYTFTPAVSEDGVISWTNNGNLPNPFPVNIKGPKGDKGDPGTGADIQAGTGLTKDEDTLNVTTPVKAVLSPSEWDALTPEQQSSGLYVVTTPSDTGTSWDVYSTEETPVGTWIDGKTIYRKTYNFTTPSAGPDHNIFSVEDLQIGTLLNIRGMVASTDRVTAISNYNGNNYYFNASLFNDNYIKASVTSSYAKKPAFIIIEYTKTTD